MNEPYSDPNFWFTHEGLPKDPVICCKNNVVVIDRKVLEYREDSDLCLQHATRHHRWACYDVSGTRHHGEWEAYRTQKKAILDMFHRASTRPKDSAHDMIEGTPAQKLSPADTQ